MNMKTIDKMWGPETDKALKNFGTESVALDDEEKLQVLLPDTPRMLIRAYGEVKLAALEGIQESEFYFEDGVMDALREASWGVIRGAYDDQFPLPMIQGGAGTSLHMNINEVIANLAMKICREGGTCKPEIDPIQDMARYQSTNDTLASAVVITAFRISEKLELLTIALQEKLVALELEYDNFLMTGRTELQDALPMRVGSLFGAWAGSVERDRWRLSKVAERVREVPLGGTALGTGFGAPRRYTHAAERHLRRITGLPLSRSQNLMDGVGLKDSLAEVAGAVKLAALNVSRITGDLLYYSSSAVGEIIHPEVQYGSSMMPLKANPVLLERSRGTALSSIGEADKVELFAREGQLQLNAYMPFLVKSLIRAGQECLVSQNDLLRFLDSMEINTIRMENFLSRSPALMNALLPLAGYRNLKKLWRAFSEEAPETLNETAALVADKTGIPLERITAALEPSTLTGPPKEQL